MWGTDLQASDEGGKDTGFVRAVGAVVRPIFCRFFAGFARGVYIPGALPPFALSTFRVLFRF